MRLKEIKCVIGGSADAFVFVSQQQRVQHIDDLSDIAHHKLIGVAMEDIQAERGRDGTADRDLLSEPAVPLLLLGNHLIPDAPFVHHEAHALAGIKGVEQSALLDDCLVELQESGELLLHRLRGKLRV